MERIRGLSCSNIEQTYLLFRLILSPFVPFNLAAIPFLSFLFLSISFFPLLPFFLTSFYASAISFSSSSHCIPVSTCAYVVSFLSFFWSKSDAINQRDYKASTAGDCSLFWVLRDEKLCIGRRYRKMKRSSCIIQSPLASSRLQAPMIRAAVYAASTLICLSVSR